MIRPLLRKVITPIAAKYFPTRWKEYNELRYWKKREASDGVLANDHYEFFYTEHFGLEKSFYAGKRILDIGCGPRGSLEWADNALQRVGLDPLADEYLKIGADKHQMEYVAEGSEEMPFEDNYFDVICSFNSIDHVEDLDKTIAEIKRVIKKDGTFLLLTDVNHKPTPTEPQEISWDLADKFLPEFEIVQRHKFEKTQDAMYRSLKERAEYDEQNTEDRYGILSAMFVAQN